MSRINRQTLQKKRNLRMEKTKETLYEDTWYQETKSICDRFYNPSNSSWDIWCISSVCTSLHKASTVFRGITTV